MPEHASSARGFSRLLFTDWFFPGLMFAWGILYFFYGEKLPVNDGLGWDGVKYAQLTRELLSCALIDNYYVFRLFVPILVNAALSVLSLELSNYNIVRAFEILNVFSLVLATYVTKLSFTELKIKPANQLLGFSLLLLSHPFAKGLLYYPVLTDAPAICLGALVLYFYLKGQSLNLLIATVISAFTLPLLLYLGLILFVFPRISDEQKPLPRWLYLLLMLCSLGFISVIIFYWVFQKNARVDYPFTLQIDPDLLFISIIFAVLPFLFLPELFANHRYFLLSYWRKEIRPLRIGFAAVVFIGIQLIASYLNIGHKQSGYLTAYHVLSSIATSGVVRPGIVLTSYFSYFGVLVLLSIFFWRSFCLVTQGFGPGLVISFSFCALLFSTNSQVRVVNSILVWLVVVLVVTLDRYSFSRWFYGSVIVANLIISRVWLPVRYAHSPVLPDGTIGFPAQKVLMNYGLWVSEQVWFIQLVAFVISFLYFLFLLYRVRVVPGGILFEKRYLAAK